MEEHREKDRINEKNAAILTASLVHGKNRQIIVINRGSSPAKNLTVILDDMPLADHPIAVKGDAFPCLVGANSEVAIMVAISTGTLQPPYRIVLTWDDDARNGNKYEHDLTFS